MSSRLDQVHERVSGQAQGWSFREQFLDTDELRQIGYGNLALRREAHLFLAHGVIVSIIVLLSFWTVSANWQLLLGWTGLFGNVEKDAVVCYQMVTNVTQLPPPPPIAPPEPVSPKAAPVAEAPPNVGKIKKVAEAPPEQTLATQKELKQAIQQGTGTDTEGMSAGFGLTDSDGAFVHCEKNPEVLTSKLPDYPEMARIAGIQGKVFVKVLVGAEGQPLKVVVLKRVPADLPQTFDHSASRWAMAARYAPGIQNGKAVKAWLTIPVRFMIN